MAYKSVTTMPTDTRNKVVSVTGGEIHPVAAAISEMTGCGVPDNLVALVDCGGTRRLSQEKNFYGNRSACPWRIHHT